MQSYLHPPTYTKIHSMFLSQQEAQVIPGRWAEFYYEVTVRYTKHSKNFGCFKRKFLGIIPYRSKKDFVLKQSVFCRSHREFSALVHSWYLMSANPILGAIYGYRELDEHDYDQQLTTLQVVELKFHRCNGRYLSYLITDQRTGIDYIQ